MKTELTQTELNKIATAANRYFHKNCGATKTWVKNWGSSCSDGYSATKLNMEPKQFKFLLKKLDIIKNNEEARAILFLNLHRITSCLQ
jgi:hypothetical protein